MNRLLKFEFRKQLRQKKFYVCALVTIGMAIIAALSSNFFINTVFQDMDAPTTIVNGARFLIDSIDGSSFILVAGIFAVLTICEDFEQHTIKNIYSRGYSRKNVFWSKVLTMSFFTGIMYLALLIVGVVMCAIFFNFDGFTELKFYAVLFTKFMIIIANNMLAVLIAFMFRKNGIAIAASIFFPMIVQLLLDLSHLVVKFENLHPSDYWVSSAGYYLTTYALDVKDILIPLAVSAAYIVIFSVLGRLVNNKTEV